MANLLMVIAPDQFRDEELFVTKEALEAMDHKVQVVSSRTGDIRGAKGGSYRVETLVSGVRATDYDALIFVGGGGTKVYFDDLSILGMARGMADAGKIVAAICIAPVILANAGLLAGREATVFESGIGTIGEGGALYRDRGVVTDGRIVTADGPDSALGFAQAIDDLL